MSDRVRVTVLRGWLLWSGLVAGLLLLAGLAAPGHAEVGARGNASNIAAQVMNETLPVAVGSGPAPAATGAFVAGTTGGDPAAEDDVRLPLILRHGAGIPTTPSPTSPTGATPTPFATETRPPNMTPTATTPGGCTTIPGAGPTPAGQLVIYESFNEGTIGTRTNVGFDTCDRVAGSASGVFAAGGSPSYVVEPDTPNLSHATLDFWFKPAVTIAGSLPNYQSLVGFSASADPNVSDAGYYDKNLYFDFDGSLVWLLYGNKIVRSTTRTWQAGQWYHIVASIGPAGQQLYVDGVREGYDPNTTTSLSFSPYYLNLGYSPVPGGYRTQFNGKIDELYLYTASTTPPTATTTPAAGTPIPTSTASTTPQVCGDVPGAAPTPAGQLLIYESFNGSTVGTATNVGFDTCDRVAGSASGVFTAGGSPSYVAEANTPNLTAVTLDFWFKPAVTVDGSLPMHQTLAIFKGSPDPTSSEGGTASVVALMTDGRLQWYVRDPDSLAASHYVYSTRSTWQASRWYHIVASVGPAGQYLYVDGVLEGSDPTSTRHAVNAPNYLLLGYTVGPGDLPLQFNGKLDEFYIYTASTTTPTPTATTTPQVCGEIPGAAPTPAGQLLIYESFNGSTVGTASNVGFDTCDRVAGSASGVFTTGGSPSYVVEANTPNLSAVTFDFWFKPAVTIDDSSSYQIMLAFRVTPDPTSNDPTSDKVLILDVDGSLAWLVFSGTNKIVHSTTRTWRSDRWYHIVASVGPAGQALYVDGVREGYDPNTTSSYPGSPYYLTLGHGVTSDGSHHQFNGKIDEFYLYNSATTAPTSTPSATPSTTPTTTVAPSTPTTTPTASTTPQACGEIPGAAPTPAGQVLIYESFNQSTVGTASNVGFDTCDRVAGSASGVFTTGGNPSYVVEANTPDVSHVTYDFWFKPAVTIDGSLQYPQGLAGFTATQEPDGTGGGNYDKAVYLDTDGRLAWYVYAGDFKIVYSTRSTWQANTWYHIVASIGPAGQQLYVDGVREGYDPNTTTSGVIDPYYLALGRGTGGAGGFRWQFNGKLDEFYLYVPETTTSAVDVQKQPVTGP